MVCFDKYGKIKKYSNTIDILKDFFEVRLEFYKKRKIYRLNYLKNELNKLENKIRFIESIISGKLKIIQRPIKDIVEDLKSQNFLKYNNYEYLLEMKINSFTKEKIEKLKNEFNLKNTEYNDLDKQTIKELWLKDLNHFETEYKKILDIEKREYEKENKRKNNYKERDLTVNKIIKKIYHNEKLNSSKVKLNEKKIIKHLKKTDMSIKK